MGGAKRYPSIAIHESMGFAKGSTHPTSYSWMEEMLLTVEPTSGRRTGGRQARMSTRRSPSAEEKSGGLSAALPWPFASLTTFFQETTLPDLERDSRAAWSRRSGPRRG